MPLNDIAIKNAKPKDKKYRVRDSDKLLLEIYPNGTKGWRVRYYRNGKERDVCLGNYPALSLKDARKRRDEINEMLAAGLDPLTEKNREKRATEIKGITFETACQKWLADREQVWSESHKVKQIIRINKHLIPTLGKFPLSELTPAIVLAVLKEIENNKLNETAHRVLGIASQIMRYAVANGWIASDPCRDLLGALAPVAVKHHAAIIEPLAIGRLLLDIDAYLCHTILL